MKSNGTAYSRCRWLAAILTVVSAGLSIWLTAQKLNGAISTLVGCGGGSDCGNVLGSKWSMVLGVIPVSGLSSLLYLGVFISLWVRGVTVSWFRQLAAWLIIGSALWFTWLQMVIIGGFCMYCMSMHAVGVFLAIVILVMEFGSKERFLQRSAVILPAALVFVMSLAVVQYFGPRPASHTMDEVKMNMAVDDIHAKGEGRMVTFFDGKKSYLIPSLPHMGNGNADYVLVKYFDYTCDACLEMHEEFDVLLDKYRESMAVIVLPVPINKACNPHLPVGAKDHEGACEFANLALRVWRADPEKFAEFHRLLFKSRGLPVEAAEAMAVELVGQDNLPQADDPWVRAVIEQNMEDYKVFSKKTGVLPKLVIKGSVLMQGSAGGLRNLEVELKRYFTLP